MARGLERMGREGEGEFAWEGAWRSSPKQPRKQAQERPGCTCQNVSGRASRSSLSSINAKKAPGRHAHAHPNLTESQSAVCVCVCVRSSAVLSPDQGCHGIFFFFDSRHPLACKDPIRIVAIPCSTITHALLPACPPRARRL